MRTVVVQHTTNGITSNRHYLSAGGQVIGVLVSSGALPTLGANQTAPTVLASITLVKLEYWHKDHLGSLITTTDHLGSVTARYAYDPFGKRRQTSGTYDPFGALVVDWVNTRNAGTDRGFTGHEHLDDVGIVHMNGRLYDPNLGVMLQPDPFIQDPANLQNFNRYGYCFNNPLTCTDPSGYLSIFGHRILPGLFNKPVFRAVVAIAIAVYAPALLAEYSSTYLATGTLANAATTGFIAGAASSGNIKGALQGAFTAGVFWGVGQVVGDAGLSRATGEIKDAGKFAGAVALHGVAGCVTAEATGGKCGAGALSAAFSKAALPMTAGMADGLERAAAHAVIGGTASVLGGGKFANGAVTGAFSYLFNHCGRGGCRQFAEEAWRKFVGSFKPPVFLQGATIEVSTFVADYSLTVDTSGRVYVGGAKSFLPGENPGLMFKLHFSMDPWAPQQKFDFFDGMSVNLEAQVGPFHLGASSSPVRASTDFMRTIDLGAGTPGVRLGGSTGMASCVANCPPEPK